LIALALLIFTLGIGSASVPAVTSISPATGINTGSTGISLAGGGFQSGATVMLTPVNDNPSHLASISDGDGGALLSGPNSVFVSGMYAYVTNSHSNALEIVDVSDPARPVHKGSITDGAGGATLKSPSFVFVYGNYAYVTSYQGSALEIIDVSDPANPVHKGSIADGAGGAHLKGPMSVFVSGNYAYVTSYQGNALEIVDVSNPASPLHKGSLMNGGGGTAPNLNGALSVFVSGNYAYVASYYNNALEIVDISDPANPVHKGNIADGAGGAQLYNADSVSVSGNYAYVTSATSNALEIIDVSDPANPVHKSALLDGGVRGASGSAPYLDNPQSICISGNYAYIASLGSKALEIVDISDPAHPVHKGSVHNGEGGAKLSGVSFVFVSGDYAYMTSGLDSALEIISTGTVTATGVSVSTPSQLTGTFDLAGKNYGAYTVVVTNPDGSFGILGSRFWILLPVPTISSVLPTSGTTAGGTAVTITGSGFTGATSVNFGAAAGTGVTVISDSRIIVTSPPHLIGTVDITVTTPGGTNAVSSSDQFTYRGIVPVVSSITPTTGPNTGSVGFTSLAGSMFQSGATVVLVPVSDHMFYQSGMVSGTGGAKLSNPYSVFASGNYAYVASSGNNALEIVDVSDPANPTHKGSIINGAGGAALSSPYSVYVSGTYAYVTSSNALEIVDVSDPANPVHKGSIADGAGGAKLQTPLSVCVSGHYAYVASYQSNALEIVDISDPAHPVHKGSIADRTGGALLSLPYSVFVSGNYAYVASSGNNALEIVDVSDPANPVHRGSIADGTGGARLSEPHSVFVSGAYAYMASYHSNALEIVDISNPANPAHKGSIANGDGGAQLKGPSSVFVSGTYAYVASYQGNALEILDVSNPANPVHAGSVVDGGGIAPFLGYPLSVYVSGHSVYVVSSVSDSLEIINANAIIATGVNVVSSSQITGTFDLTGKRPGGYDILVTNPDGQKGTSTSVIFTVTSSIPSQTSAQNPAAPGTDTSDNSGRPAAYAITAPGTGAGGTMTFAVNQPINAGGMISPCAILAVSIEPVKTLGTTELIVSNTGTSGGPEGRTVAGVFQIEPVAVNPSAIGPGTLTFAVSDAWLSAHGLTPTQVVLMRYHDAVWTELPTTYQYRDKNAWYFAAATPGFSYFAVTHRVAGPSTGSVSPRASPVVTMATDSPGAAAQISAHQKSVITTPARTFAPVTSTNTIPPPAKAASAPGFPFAAAILIGAGCVVLIGIIWYIRRWRLRRQDQFS
jgi:Uncharacterized conserved protein